MDRAEAIKTMLKAETLKKSGSMVQVKMAAASMQQAENADNELRFDDALKLFKESLEQWKAVELNTLPKELCVNIEEKILSCEDRIEDLELYGSKMKGLD